MESWIYHNIITLKPLNVVTLFLWAICTRAGKFHRGPNLNGDVLQPSLDF